MRWTITVQYDVPRFANIEVYADTEAEAICKAIKAAPGEEFETAWDASGEYYAFVLPELNEKCEQHRDDGRGRCIDCDEFIWRGPQAKDPAI